MKLSSLFVVLAFLLTSCIELKGVVAVSSAGLVSGELNYSIDKSFASSAGILSLADFKKAASENPGSLDSSCTSLVISEDESNYKMRCTYVNSSARFGDLQSKVENGQVIFTFKSNSDAPKDSSQRTDFGTIDIVVTFENSVIEVVENKRGLVQRITDKSYRINGYGTEPMDIKIVSTCSSGCVSTSTQVPTRIKDPRNADELAKQYAAEATDLANLQTEIANSVAEAADKSTVVSEYVRDILDSASSAAQNRNVSAFPSLDNIYVQSNLNDLKLSKEKFGRKKVELEVIAKNYDLASELNANYKRLSIMAKKSLSDLERGLSFVSKASDLLTSLPTEWSKQKAILDSPKVTPSVSPSQKSTSSNMASKTIKCVKGKQTLKVIGKNPKCPSGYKKQ